MERQNTWTWATDYHSIVCVDSRTARQNNCFLFCHGQLLQRTHPLFFEPLMHTLTNSRPATRSMNTSQLRCGLHDKPLIRFVLVVPYQHMVSKYVCTCVHTFLLSQRVYTYAASVCYTIIGHCTCTCICSSYTCEMHG